MGTKKIKNFVQVVETGLLERISREQRQLQEAMFEVRACWLQKCGF
jgi:hypothetical protein